MGKGRAGTKRPARLYAAAPGGLSRKERGPCGGGTQIKSSMTTAATDTPIHRQQTGTRKKIECSPERLKALAANGYSIPEIAERMHMSVNTLYDNLRRSITVSRALDEGRKLAGIFTGGPATRSLWA